MASSLTGDHWNGADELDADADADAAESEEAEEVAGAEDMVILGGKNAVKKELDGERGLSNSVQVQA